ncbi:MAG: hypothetical protein JWL81_2601, partial [Verrucomicrobiales bacterium]|nr:hypothetical protein [Verrucomicrobiales bacterium]
DFNLIDPQTLTVLGLSDGTIPGTDFPNPYLGCELTPLTGFYTALDLDVSLNEIFGIPDTCFLRVTGHVGVGNFCFFQDRGPNRQYLIPGVRYRFGVSGEVLCVLDLSAIAAIAVKVEVPVGNLDSVLSEPANFLGDLSNATATGYGEIEFKAGIGIGPFKIPVSKTLGMTMELSKDDVDVSFDY